MGTDDQGLKINETIQLQFCDKIPKFSRNLATFSRRIFDLHFLVSSLAKQNMSPQYLCVKKPLKMVNDRKDTTLPVFNAMLERSNIAAELRYNFIKIKRYLQLEKIHDKKQNNFVQFLYYITVAANWQLVILLFQKSGGKNKSQICDFSGYFSRKGNKLSCKCNCIGRNFEL